MVNWTDHGSPISLESFSWARDRAWAAQCIERNGKFYWYICVQSTKNDMSIGVAVSDSPTGPFKDASAGVINIITKSAKDGTFGNASVEYGRYDSKISKATISHKNKSFDAKLSATRVDTDGFSSISPKSSEAKNYEKDRYGNTTVDLKLGYNFDDSNRLLLPQ